MILIWNITIMILAFVLINMTIPKLLNDNGGFLIPAIPNQRSAHEVTKYSSTGVLFIPFLIIALIPYFNLTYCLLSAILIALNIMGYVDDKKNISASFRVFIEILCATLLWSGGTKIFNLYGLFGIYELTDTASLIITIVVFTAIVNAYNLIDGVDGLAAGIALISGITFSIIFQINENYALMTFSLSIVACTLAFLKFNFYPSKVFMGDSGSLLLGGALAFLFIESMSIQNGAFVGCSLSLLLIPLIDMSRVVIFRLANRNSPFKADKNHYHHLLLDNKHNHRKIALTCWMQTIIFLVFWVIFLANSSPLKQLIIVTLFACTIYIYSQLISLVYTSKKLAKVQDEKETILLENKLHQLIYKRYEKNISH